MQDLLHQCSTPGIIWAPLEGSWTGSIRSKEVLIRLQSSHQAYASLTRMLTGELNSSKAPLFWRVHCIIHQLSKQKLGLCTVLPNLRQMTRGEIPFQKASGGMHAGLSEGEFRGRDSTAAPRKRFITRPHSRKRMLWDLFGLVLVVWVACLTK